MVKKVNSVSELFSYLRVGTLNNHMLNVLQAENRALNFHIHEHSDEMFYCIEGEFDIEFDDGLIHLVEGDFIIIHWLRVQIGRGLREYAPA